MAETKVIMPQMGESIFEGTITKWLKKTGDRVERDEPLFEISTDKIDTEIPSPASGVVQDILVKEGQTVQINTVVAVIGDGAAKPAPQTEVKGPAPIAGPTKEVEKETKEAPVAQQRPAAPPPPSPPSPPSPPEQNVRSSPLVRRIAKDSGVDLSALAGRGTGLNGRITKNDILGYIERTGKRETGAPVGRPVPAETRAYVPPEPSIKFNCEVERTPHTAMQKAIAEHMVMSRKTSAHVTTLFEVDCLRIMKAKEKQQAEFERNGVRLTVTCFFVQAAANALKRFPIVNSSLEGDTIVYKRAI